MYVTLRVLVLSWVVIAGTCVAEEPNAADWTKKIMSTVLRSAEIEVLRQPNLQLQLATFKIGDKVAATDFNPGPRFESFVKAAEASCEVVPQGLKPGTEYYTDRTYKLIDVPEKLRGLSLLRTRMGHKAIIDGRYSIVLGFSEPGYCFVAVDERCMQTYEEGAMPSWLEEFAPTNFRITTSDANMRRVGLEFHVFVKPVSTSKIALGPSASQPQFNSMYFAFFASTAPAEGEPPRR